MAEQETDNQVDSLLGHLYELRNRLMYSVLAWFACSALAYLYTGMLMQWLTMPLAHAFDNPEARRLIFTSLPEAFVTYIKMALFAGFLLSFPIIAFQLYRFVAPGLYRKEKRTILPFIIAAPILFYAGGALAYFYIFPMAWEFFVGFELFPAGGEALPVELEAKLSDYLGLITSIILAFGIAFQLPLALLLLIKAGLLEVATLKKGRRYAIVILLAVAAVLTPPDIISQLGLFSALYVLYEAAILCGGLMKPKQVDDIVASS